MPDCADIEAFTLTLAEAAVLFDEALRVIGTLEAACINDRPEHAPLPRGMLSCGEAVRITSTLIILLAQQHPRLLEPGMLEGALTFALMNGVGGEAN